MSTFNSEIVRQRKNFIFNVEQSSNYVFPREEYIYLLYIKNTSGEEINNFNIKIECPDEVFIEKVYNKPDSSITIKNNEALLYEFNSSIETPGEYIVHFIGYGENTQIAHKILKIKCSRSYNSDKLLHRIYIYDFTPYENNFSMEASNYSDEVIQTFKRQKLPYKAGDQPFRMIESDSIENVESESFIDQNNEASNSKEEHVYQYISRENFTENSLEFYEGENLYSLINQINNESNYFNAIFLKSGTNSLLNDFTQYKPNGFIYRMGLLTSELYHTLGVIPTYDYMSDRLFRWAPSPTGQKIFYDRDADEMESINELLNLYPRPKSMNWDENIWAGRGWIVYKTPTDEYKQTEEFRKLFDDKIISLRENIGSFEEKKDAEKFVEQREYFDNVVRNQIQDPLVKYKYEIDESLYDTGIFFINIPIDKIPSNFYLLDTEDLYKIINRAKPYGVRAIINYVIEREFNLNLDQDLILQYEKNFNYDIGSVDLRYNIYQNKFVKETISCDNRTVDVIKEVPVNCAFYDYDFVLDPSMEVDYSQVGVDLFTNDYFDMDIEEKVLQYRGHMDQDFRTLENLLFLLYHNNYNNISFRIIESNFDSFPTKTTGNFIVKDGELFLEKEGADPSFVGAIKLPIIVTNDEQYLSIEDSFDRKHKISAQYDSIRNLYYIQYVYTNSKGKSYIRKEGFQNIDGIVCSIEEYNNRRVLILMVEDKDKNLHYFYHTIIEEVKGFESSLNRILRYSWPLKTKKVLLETPFCYSIEKYSPTIKRGDNWTNLYRINNDVKTYSYIQNKGNSFITPDDIYLHFDNINIPKTSLIKEVRLNLNGSSSKKRIYLDKSIGENYKIQDVNGYSLELKPNKMTHYSQNKESNGFYKEKLNIAKEKEQETLIEYYQKLIDKNDIFNEDVNLEISDYMDNYNDYITISKGFWNELSEFTDLEYNLNDTENIFLTIEGFNDGYELNMLSQVISDLDQSSVVKTKVPEGYFFLEIPLLYSNTFLLNLFKVRFRFEGLNHQIKIFNTTLDVRFKTKQEDNVLLDFVEDFYIEPNTSIKLSDEHIFPQDFNNGVLCRLSFEDINPGEFYHLNQISLDIVYQDTDVELMINKNKYRYEPIGESQTTIIGKTSNDCLLSGEFYNDVESISQLESDVGIDNQGIELEDAIYQEFEARDDNITSIELFPNGFVGNPDEMLKIGIYSSHENTPYKLIKEIYANGWVKTNDELKKLPSIKYNLNVDNLEIDKRYWIKIEVLNPRENSYYLLKSVNKTLPTHRLLYMKNNNYINTFSSLTFNIYTKNLSKSFRKLPTVQEFFDNPYILIGLHRGVGTVNDLTIDKWDSTVEEEDHMKGYFNTETEMIIDDREKGIGIVCETDGKELIANFEQNKWDLKG